MCKLEQPETEMRHPEEASQQYLLQHYRIKHCNSNTASTGQYSYSDANASDNTMWKWTVLELAGEEANSSIRLPGDRGVRDGRIDHTIHAPHDNDHPRHGPGHHDII